MCNVVSHLRFLGKLRFAKDKAKVVRKKHRSIGSTLFPISVTLVHLSEGACSCMQVFLHFLFSHGSFWLVGDATFFFLNRLAIERGRKLEPTREGSGEDSEQRGKYRQKAMWVFVSCIAEIFAVVGSSSVRKLGTA